MDKNPKDNGEKTTQDKSVEKDIMHRFDELVKPHVQRLTVLRMVFRDADDLHDLRKDIAEDLQDGVFNILAEATDALREFENFLESVT
jgi:hypothetical protein